VAPHDTPAPASFTRRVASMVYEALVVMAILFAASFFFFSATGFRAEGLTRHLFQTYLALVLSLYFVWCWRRGGQTLPMKAWKLRLVRHDGAPVEVRRAIARYIVAALAFGSGAVAATLLWREPYSIGAWGGCVPLALDLLWSFFDRDRQFLHDRLVGTRIVSAAPPTTSSPLP